MRIQNKGLFGSGVLVDALLAVGLALTASTQLRPASLPVGPAELMLICWLGLSASLALLRREGALSKPCLYLLVFWIVFAIAECIGSLMGMFIGDLHDTGLVLHDVFAYALAAALSLMFVWRPDAGVRLHRVAWITCYVGAFLFSAQLASAFGAFEISGVETWYWDRLRGWSENPNQLAMLATALMLLSLNQAETAEAWGRRLLALIFAAIAAIAGHLSKSDTFHGVAVLSVAAFFGLKLFERGLSRQALTTSSALGAIGLVAIPLLVLSAAPLLGGEDSITKMIVSSLAKDNGESVGKEADLRIQIWRRALERGAEASMMGLGPGPHLEIPSEIVSERRTNTDVNVVHPEVNITANFESHNNFLEMYLQGGLIAALGLAWLLSTAFLKAYRQSIFLAVALLGITTFGLTGVNLRQPIYWFSIALCLTSEQRTATRSLSAATSSHKVFALC